jgi:hypothetical protein
MISLSKFFASGGEITEWKMGITQNVFRQPQSDENVDLLYEIRFGKRQLQQPNDERSRFEVPKGDKEKTKESHNSFIRSAARACRKVVLNA